MSHEHSSWVEEYEFLRLYRIDVESARQLFELVERQGTDELRFPLLEIAVVRYARPFSKNFGSVIKRHWLDDTVVPPDMLSLHSELIGLRDNAFAHTDHKFRKPEVSRWKQSDGSNRYGLAFRIADYTLLLRRLAALKDLARAVEAAIVAKCDAMQPVLDTIPAAPRVGT